VTRSDGRGKLVLGEEDTAETRQQLQEVTVCSDEDYVVNIEEDDLQVFDAELKVEGSTNTIAATTPGGFFFTETVRRRRRQQQQQQQQYTICKSISESAHLSHHNDGSCSDCDDEDHGLAHAIASSWEEQDRTDQVPGDPSHEVSSILGSFMAHENDSLYRCEEIMYMSPSTDFTERKSSVRGINHNGGHIAPLPVPVTETCRKRPRTREIRATTSSPTAIATSTRSTERDDDINLPFGYFTGKDLFRNRLNKNECLGDGHLSIRNLIPPSCQLSLITTFETPDLLWMKQTLHQIPQLILVAHSKPGAGDKHRGEGHGDDYLGGAPIGSSKAEPITNRPGWFWIAVAPHVGLMHAKILLFRCPRGLRIVVSGNNFVARQWTTDRDCLWVHDAPVVEHKNGEESWIDNRPYCAGTELSHLRSFVEDVTTSHLDGSLITEKIHDLFDRIRGDEIVGARFVYSFPRNSSPTDGSPRADRGGWQQLAQAMYRFRKEAGHSTSYAAFHKQKQELKNLHLYAMSGSMGDLKPEFLMQMRHALTGQLILPQEVDWEDIQRTYILWPSQSMIETMSLGIGRAMGKHHWARIPLDDRKRLFFEAVPAPNNAALGHCKAFTHGKVIFVEQESSSGGTCEWGAVYVGSHNFSKAAWGLRNSMPKNIEFGIVLFTEDDQNLNNWRSRLPYALPIKNSISDVGYELGRFRHDDLNYQE